MAKKYLCDLKPGDKIYHASIYNAFKTEPLGKLLSENMREKCRRHVISTSTLTGSPIYEIFEDDVLMVNDVFSSTGTSTGTILIAFGNSYLRINKNLQSSAISTELGNNTKKVYATNKKDLLEELYDLALILKELSLCEHKHKNDCYKEILKNIRNEKDK